MNGASPWPSLLLEAALAILQPAPAICLSPGMGPEHSQAQAKSSFIGQTKTKDTHFGEGISISHLAELLVHNLHCIKQSLLMKFDTSRVQQHLSHDLHYLSMVQGVPIH